MKHSQKPIFQRVAVALLVSVLGGCAVVPYGPPGYYGYREPTYGPVVPVPVPFFWPGHHGRHGHHGHHGHHR